MSTKIFEMANAGLEQLRSGEVSYFDWRIRREIYKTINAEATSIPSPHHQFLAIQSAEFVMPFFVPVEAHDQLVFQLVESAKAVSENRVADIEKIEEIEDAGYYASQWFGYNFETKKRNFQSAYAGGAAYQALIEVRYKLDPWEGIDPLIEVTDDNWKTGPYGDTAVLASFAYSTSPTSEEWQPKLLYEFWEWWVKVALPNALK